METRDAIPAGEREERSAAVCGKLLQEIEGFLGNRARAGATGNERAGGEPQAAKAGLHPVIGYDFGSERADEPQAAERRNAAIKSEGTGGQHSIEEPRCDDEWEAAENRPPTIALYAAMGSEVDLRMLAEQALERGYRLAFPVMLPAPASSAKAAKPMAFVAVTAQTFEQARTLFLCNPMRRFAPADLDREGFPALDLVQIDVFIVPLVAFDQHGHRLGYGGGCYDAVLARLQPGQRAIGVAFAEQRAASVPIEPHDIPLSRIAIA